MLGLGLSGQDLAQLALELFGRVAAADDVKVVDDHGGDAAHTALRPGLFLAAHLGAIAVRGQDPSGFGPSRPAFWTAAIRTSASARLCNSVK